MGATVRGSSSWQKIRCPFHNDKTPSATVNVVEDRFFCFGCGINEDLIGLIMLREGLPYVEAKRQVEESSREGDNEISGHTAFSEFLPRSPRNKPGNSRAGDSWRSRLT